MLTSAAVRIAHGVALTMIICQLYATLRPHATHWSHMTLSCPGILVGTHVGFALRFSGVSRIRFTFRMARTRLLESYSHSRLLFVPLLPYRDYVQSVAL